MRLSVEFADFVPCTEYIHTPQQAFRYVCDNARMKNVREGAPLSALAQKTSFTVFGSMPTVDEAYYLAHRTLAQPNDFGKWDPAGCITVEEPSASGAVTPFELDVEALSEGEALLLFRQEMHQRFGPVVYQQEPVVKEVTKGKLSHNVRVPSKNLRLKYRVYDEYFNSEKQAIKHAQSLAAAELGEQEFLQEPIITPIEQVYVVSASLSPCVLQVISERSPNTYHIRVRFRKAQVSKDSAAIQGWVFFGTAPLEEVTI